MKLSLITISIVLISTLMLPNAAFGQNLIVPTNDAERNLHHRIVEAQSLKMPIFITTIALTASLITISIALSKSFRVG
ncbi:hypothetical protein V2H45_01115 [Tumidithrix elongata RA019]|uniref:Uncharacterized protein n=1 Tax=Tumidithrix elongata BACA0141 TaxID=2716417 RepID=A0AAW9PPZ8_9CYAN|nr:hypothetical protein [Tumidithrix elongata RA019]